MLHKAWNSKGEMPVCVPRSSIIFQGHTVQNITDFDPNWAFLDYRPVAAFKSLRFALFKVLWGNKDLDVGQDLTMVVGQLYLVAELPVKLVPNHHWRHNCGGLDFELWWRHNAHDGVSNHQPHHYLLNRLFRGRSKKTPKLHFTGLFAGNSPVTGEFPAQMASNAENVSIRWRHNGISTKWFAYWDNIHISYCPSTLFQLSVNSVLNY